MQICELEPQQWGGSNTVAKFSVKLSEDLKLVALRLCRRGDGAYRTRAPNINGKAAFHVGPELAEKITAAAVEAYRGGRTANENRD